MTFKPIQPGHPYLDKVDPNKDPDTQLFQPTDAEWPIYSIAVHSLVNGFSIGISVMHKPNTFWETCNYFNPIPYELGAYVVSVLSAKMR